MPTLAKDRLEVYDWLRGWACLAVMAGHFKPFGLPKAPFLWSVHVFVLVTFALFARSPLTWPKAFRRLCYVAFVYAALTLVFQALMHASGSPQIRPLAQLFTRADWAVEHPYFGHIWYVTLYTQLLGLAVVAGERWRHVHPALLLGACAVAQQAGALFTHHVLHRFYAIFVPSWLFVIALGWSVLPRVAEAAERAERRRAWRWAGALLALVAIFAWGAEPLHLNASRHRSDLANTLLYFFVAYFLIESFYLARRWKSLVPLRGFVSVVSRYTLILYMYHQALYSLLAPRFPEAGFPLMALSVVTGVPCAAAIHRGYAALEKAFLRRKAVRPPQPSAAESRSSTPEISSRT